MVRGGAIVLACALGGCASITPLGNTFEGAADYRVVPQQDLADSKVSPLLGEVSLDDYPRFQQHPASVNTGNPNYFTSGDYIQVALRTGVIGWFSEGAEQQALNSLLGSRLKGEIAILANVTEGTRNPGSRDQNGNLEGRVVFYSGDIYVGQRLNEFNVPIYGPAEYKGGSLTIDLWVVELDRAESQQMEAVLTTLASLSTEIPSMSIPGIDILSQIGTAFLKSNQDDVIGHITLTLTQPRPGQRTQDPVLQVSDLIVSRGDNRDENASPLKNCKYEPSTGRVFGTDGGTCGGMNRDNVFVLGIRKVPQGQAIAPTVTLAELTDRVSRATVGSAATPNLSAAINEAADYALSQSAYTDSMVAIERLRNGSIGGPQQVDAETILKNYQCSLLALRATSTATLEAACGARAADRQMGINNLSRLSTLLVTETCIRESDLSIATLVPPDPTPQALQGARDAVAKFLKKPPPPTVADNPKSACTYS